MGDLQATKTKGLETLGGGALGLPLTQLLISVLAP